MGEVNVGADLDDVDVRMEPMFSEISSTAQIPHVMVTQPTIDEDDASPVRDRVSSRPKSSPGRRQSAGSSSSGGSSLQNAPHVPAIPEISTEEPTGVTVISPRPDIQLEKPLRRKFLTEFINVAAKMGRAFDKVPFTKNASIKMTRFAHRLSSGGLWKEKFGRVKSDRKRVGNDNQYLWWVYYERPNVSQNRIPRQPVVFYVHGNLPYDTARSYHSFSGHLCIDLLDSNAIVVVFDYANAPERTFVQILDDIVQQINGILVGEFDNDFEYFGLSIDHEKVVLAGDGAGALLCFAASLELRQAGDRPNLHGLLLLSPPLQALTTQMFESHIKYASLNCESMFHCLDAVLPLYAGIRVKADLELARKAIQSERHVPNDLRTRLLRRIFPTFEAHSQGDDTEPAGAFGEICQLSTSSKIWPMLMKNREIAVLPMVMMQACENDPLFDEQRLFAKRLSKVCGYRFRFSVVNNAVHNETVQHRLLKTQSANHGYREVLDFLKETIAKPSQHRGGSATDPASHQYQRETVQEGLE